MFGNHRDHSLSHHPARSSLAKGHDVLTLNLFLEVFPEVKNGFRVEQGCVSKGRS
jgi:hypothetical protein